MKNLFVVILTLFFLQACTNRPKTEDPKTLTDSTLIDAFETPDDTTQEHVNITPISHATMVLRWGETVIYVDPVGGVEAFQGQPKPNIVLVTDIHGDHLSAETIAGIMGNNTVLIVPQAVADKLPKELQATAQILNNDENTQQSGLNIAAIPMYNLREEAKEYHVKGRGNGYLIEKEGERVYISGDTEGIPEMRNLKNIDIAFVCMNLPYTMPVEDAADAVLAFKPSKVYPYHFRGKDGMSDVSKFKELVNAGDSDIEVVQLDWYPAAP